MPTFFDPRTIATPVYEALSELKDNRNKGEPSEQKSQAVELYTYLSTWGLMRLKAEEKALNQEGKKQVVKKYFDCLSLLSGYKLSGEEGLDFLKNLAADDYLGLTGLGLALAQEFSFWSTAVYRGIDESN
ncbi:MAG: hypothetical protein HC910_20110 [Spirulinaceae cyanobacterium SM2_1_0]|nr:hypothetical protein [Spirulinaceae cyanobacterium SM2_1_0]